MNNINSILESFNAKTLKQKGELIFCVFVAQILVSSFLLLIVNLLEFGITKF